MRRMRCVNWVTVVGASSLIAGCACDGAGPRAGGGAETAVAERTPHASETDPDGDGPERTATPDPTDCDELGINADEQHEGNCQSEGTKLQVVNRDSPLKLDEVTVAYNGISYAESLTHDLGLGAQSAFGRFVIVNVTVTNRTDSPMDLSAYEMFALALTEGDRTRTYSADFGAMSIPGPSLVWSEDAGELQPEAAVTGTVVFDVPEERVDSVEKLGNLSVLQPSDIWSFDGPEKRQGILRLYD